MGHLADFYYFQKIQKVTGGLTRLASRTKVKKEETIRMRYSSLPQCEIAAWTVDHAALVKDLVEVRAKQHQQAQVHMQRYVLEEWLQTETELTRERGLWGPTVPCRYTNTITKTFIILRILIRRIDGRVEHGRKVTLNVVQLWQ
jgi:hypothetical protein